jgi:hypothetical protein
MSAWIYVVVAVGIAVMAYLILRKPVRQYLAVRGDRVVACPENSQTVAVRVDATRAAVGSLFKSGQWSLESCTRWPEKAGCGQECLTQIHASPNDCLVKTQVTRWYAGKACTTCGKALGVVEFGEHSPAVMAPSGQTLQWRDVKPETLAEIFATHAPVCWDCHVAETFRRTRPELVIDNPLPPTHRP